MESIKLTKRQEEIIQIVKMNGPIPGKDIAEMLSLTRATLRPDLSILTKVGNLEARPRVGYYYNTDGESKEYIDWFANHLVNEYKAHPIVIKKSTSVYDAIVQIFLKDVGTLYAVNQKGYLAGVISRKDLLRASIGNRNLHDLPVSVIMTRMPNVMTVKPEVSLLEAATMMIDYHIDSLPVVQEVEQKPNTYTVIGRITKTTISRAFLEMANQ